MSKGKKRFWSDDEKREICTQTRIDSGSVAQVARRYAVNANLIHKWLRDPRFTALADDPTDYVDAAFLAVEIHTVWLIQQKNRHPFRGRQCALGDCHTLCAGAIMAGLNERLIQRHGERLCLDFQALQFTT
jgi:hypothetical protein